MIADMSLHLDVAATPAQAGDRITAVINSPAHRSRHERHVRVGDVNDRATTSSPLWYQDTSAPSCLGER